MITFKICSQFYSHKAIQDCVYWFSEDVLITVRMEEGHYLIDCRTDNVDIEKQFIQRLNDYNLRETIYQRTSGLKDLIIAKAFYPESIAINPVGNFEDPVMMDKRDEAE